MTTRVTVDAHAGWPVLVEYISGEPNYPQTLNKTVVPAYAQTDFYIHSGMYITRIMELSK